MGVSLPLLILTLSDAIFFVFREHAHKKHCKKECMKLIVLFFGKPRASSFVHAILKFCICFGTGLILSTK
jgi:hypothetical protein